MLPQGGIRCGQHLLAEPGFIRTTDPTVAAGMGRGIGGAQVAPTLAVATHGAGRDLEPFSHHRCWLASVEGGKNTETKISTEGTHENLLARLDEECLIRSIRLQYGLELGFIPLEVTDQEPDLLDGIECSAFDALAALW